LYHSGDTVVYPGLADELLTQRIDAALLPVNGRGKGVAGNMTFDEAMALCVAAKIPVLLPHHFGMFAFNTVAESELRALAATASAQVQIVFPAIEHWLEISG
jgi:L-ascorbate metabolism protein UlaG (beta-lactamase superfamily)